VNRSSPFFAWLAILALGSPLRAAWALDTSQRQISELELFNRCFGHLTQSRLPLGHSLRARIIQGSLSGIEACMALVDSAALVGPGSPNEGQLIVDTPEARTVLKTLNDFHRSWFPNDSLETSITVGDLGFPRTHDLTDETESALHITRALLTDGVKYSESVTSSFSVEGLRSGGAMTDAAALPAMRLQHASAINSLTLADINALLVEKGELLGVRRITDILNTSKYNQTVNPSDAILDRTGNRYTYQTAPIDVHRNLGGGAGLISTRSYFMLNQGRSDRLQMDGGIGLHRRWSKAILHDTMCRELPVIRTTDATPYVQTAVTSATPPFRTSRNCMGCHATMDPMASVIRNHSLYFVPSMSANGNIVTAQVASWPITLPREAGQVDSDLNFYQRPPNGRFFYRSYDGTLIKRDLLGLASLGAAISESKDFYACAASRYLEFFTGIRVGLHDVGDPGQAPLNDAERYYRGEVIRIGEALRIDAKQSLRTLIYQILSSELYRKNSMRQPGSGN